MGLLQLGFFTIFLSESLVSGYTTGAATHVFTSQVKYIFGIKITAGPGVLQLPKVWIEVFEKIFQWPREVNTATFVVSLIAITILVLVHLLNILLSKPIPCAVANCKTMKCRIVKKIRWPIPIPGPLVVVILGTAVSYSAKLDTAYNVTVVGTIPSGPPSISYPVFYFAPYLIVDAITISIVTFAVSISVAKLFSRQFNYEVDSNQELAAFGVSNVIGSFFSSFSISGSLARSLVQVKTGGKTQLVSLISSAVILVVILALGFLFEPLPRAVLASIIWVALYGMFKKVKDVYKYFKTSKSDMLIWLVVFLSTVLLGVDLGLGVGVAFSLMVVIVRTVLPHSSIFIREDWKHSRSFIQNFEEPGSGVLLYRFHAPLCFLNVAVFRKNMEILTEVEHFEKDKEEPGCLQVLWLKLYHRYKRCHAKDGKVSGELGVSLPSTANTDSLDRTNPLQTAANVDIVEDMESITPTQTSVKKNLHTIIVDCAPFGFLDIAGVKALEQAVVDFKTCGIQVLLAAMGEGNRDMLERAGFYETCGKEWLFPSIQDAVQHAKHETRLVPMLNDSTASVEDEVALANTNHVQSTESSSVSVINLE